MESNNAVDDIPIRGIQVVGQFFVNVLTHLL